VGWIGASTKRDEKGQLAVTEVIPNGPAARAGLRTGDFITAVNDEPVTSGASFDVAIAACAPGSQIQLNYMRGAWVRQAVIIVGAE
jgi:S1-C subfamily serine protease